MANHMAEVVKMLGIELGKEFKCDDGYDFSYCITNETLLCNGSPAADSLMMMLDGRLTVKRKPWKPSYYERYYSVGPGGVLEPGTWLNDLDDLALFKLGNCYSSVSEAEANRGKWVKFYASDGVLEV